MLTRRHIPQYLFIFMLEMSCSPPVKVTGHLSWRGHFMMSTRSTFTKNLFIYQAREFSLVPVRFLTALFLQKVWFMKHLFWWEEIGWFCSALPPRRKGEVLRSLEGWWMDLSPRFLFSMQSMEKNPTLVLPSQQSFDKLCFLQNGLSETLLGPEWWSFLVKGLLSTGPAPSSLLKQGAVVL